MLERLVKKNQILLIKAMKYLRDKSKLKYNLIIIGNGDLYKFLIENIKKYDLSSNIKILRDVTDPY